MSGATTKPKATVTHDKKAGCWRATAPERFRFESGPHELCEWYDGFGGRSKEAGEALNDLIERTVQDGLEPCTEHPCDWCDEPEFDESAS